MIAAILAFWFHVGSWVTPFPAPTSYRLISITGANPTPMTKTAYRRPSVPLTGARTPGERDSCWVWMTEAPVAGGTIYRIVPVYADSAGKPSNVILVNGGVSNEPWQDVSEAIWLTRADDLPGAAHGIKHPTPAYQRPTLLHVAFWHAPGWGDVLWQPNPCLTGRGPLVRWADVAGRPVCCDSAGVMVTRCER